MTKTYIVFDKSPHKCSFYGTMQKQKRRRNSKNEKSIKKDEVIDEKKYVANIYATENTADELENIENVVVSENISVTALATQKRQKVKKREKSKETSQEWNVKMINADTNIDNNAKTDKIKVAILDSGVDMSDEIDVAERINLVPGEEEVLPIYEDTTGHGTSIAGIIAAKDNGEGITGINPNVEIYSARILDDNNEATLSRVVEGIYWAIEKK